MSGHWLGCVLVIFLNIASSSCFANVQLLEKGTGDAINNNSGGFSPVPQVSINSVAPSSLL